MTDTHVTAHPTGRVASQVQLALDAFFTQRRQTLDAISAETAALVEAARAATRSGKCLRPAFCYWGYRAVGGDPARPIIEMATALEMLHAAALVHDDIIDAAPTRRGVPSAQMRFAALAAEWRPGEDCSEFSLAASILLGDLLLMWADELLSSCAFELAALGRARSWFDLMRAEVLAGEYLELVAQARRETDVAGALLILRYKSATYSVQRPLQMGAALADARPAELATLGEFGLAVGEAFQLRDDLLGTFGDPALIGKPVGIDLRDGKCSPLIALTRMAAGRDVVREIDRLSSLPALAADEIALLRSIVVDSGALARYEEMIAERLERALLALHRVSFPDEEAVNALEALAVMCAQGGQTK